MMLLVSVMTSSCRKESQIRSELTPGCVAAVSAYRVLSVLHLGEELAFRRIDGFFTSLAIIHKTDSLYTDGDALEFSIDFGKGVVCTDGIMRKGKCNLRLVDSAYPQVWFQWSSSGADSFAVSSKTGWEFVTGTTTLSRSGTLNASLEFDLEFGNEKGLLLRRCYTPDTIAVLFYQPVQNSKNGESWIGKWAIGTADHDITAETDLLINSGSCRSNWNRGILNIKTADENFTVEIDPYGNEACDQVYKVSKKTGIFSDEMTFDAW